MKASKARMICITALFVLASFGTSFGQGCFHWMIPQYNTYLSESTDGTHIYSSVLIDGTTGGTCTSSGGCDHCSQILNPPPLHTPEAYNLLGSTGGWASGTAQQWNEYISEQNNQSVAAQPGANVAFQAEGQVVCSVAGTLVTQTFPTTNLRITNPYYGPPPTVYNDNCYYTTLACSTGTPTCTQATPGITFVPSCPDYMLGRYLVVNGKCEFGVGTGVSGPGPCD